MFRMVARWPIKQVALYCLYVVGSAFNQPSGVYSVTTRDIPCRSWKALEFREVSCSPWQTQALNSCSYGIYVTDVFGVLVDVFGLPGSIQQGASQKAKAQKPKVLQVIYWHGQKID